MPQLRWTLHAVGHTAYGSLIKVLGAPDNPLCVRAASLPCNGYQESA